MTCSTCGHPTSSVVNPGCCTYCIAATQFAEIIAERVPRGCPHMLIQPWQIVVLSGWLRERDSA